jgi:hypothetical protein
MEEKNGFSHRRKALDKLVEFLNEIQQTTEFERRKQPNDS